MAQENTNGYYNGTDNEDVQQLADNSKDSAQRAADRIGDIKDKIKDALDDDDSEKENTPEVTGDVPEADSGLKDNGLRQNDPQSFQDQSGQDVEKGKNAEPDADDKQAGGKDDVPNDSNPEDTANQGAHPDRNKSAQEDGGTQPGKNNSGKNDDQGKRSSEKNGAGKGSKDKSGSDADKKSIDDNNKPKEKGDTGDGVNNSGPKKGAGGEAAKDGAQGAEASGKAAGAATETAGATAEAGEQTAAAASSSGPALPYILLVLLVIVAVVMCAIMVITTITAMVGYFSGASSSISSGTSSGFTPRTEAPDESNKYYSSSTYNGYAGSAYGLFEARANGHQGNCVAYAFGRAAELLGSKPNLSTGNARDWWGYNQTTKAYESGNTPKLGAILCISDNGSGAGGHVAVVEEIYDNGDILTSESGWDSYFFKTVKRTKASNYTNGSSVNSNFQGFIYIVDETTISEATGTGLTSSQLSEDENKALSFFTSRGLSKATTCGIMANIMTECSFSSYWYNAEYVPDALGASGNSGGICMWYAENNTRFRRDCPNWRNGIEYQLEYLYQTLLNDGKGGPSTKYYYYCPGCLSAMKAVPNTKAGACEAADIMEELYERPAESLRGTRGKWASYYWDRI